MLDNDDAKKLVTAALIWKFFSYGRKSQSSLPSADLSCRPRYFRRWLAVLVVLVSIALWRYEGDGAFDIEFDGLGDVWGSYLVGLYGMFVLFFVHWTIKKIWNESGKNLTIL